MMWATKGTEKNEEFTTGSKRGSQEGKTRFDLIDPYFLKELGDLLERGSKLYGEANWTLGQPLSRTYASLLRHVYALALTPEDDENHMAAVAFNIMVITHHVKAIAEGKLPEELADTEWSKTLVKNYKARISRSTAPSSDDTDYAATILRRIVVNRVDRA